MSDQSKLFKKLAAVMGSLERLPKTGRNKNFNYDFVTDADVTDALRSKLAQNGIAFFASMLGIEREPFQTQKGASGTKYIVHSEYVFADSETGATWACEWYSEADDYQDKGISKAATSGLKYFLLKTFLLSTGEPVDDPDNSTDESPRARSPKQQPRSVLQTISPQETVGKPQLSRPLSPEQLKGSMLIKAAKYTNPANEKQMKYARSSLDTLCGQNEANRHAISSYLFGKGSSTDWTSGEASAIIEWIGAKADNDFTPVTEAIQEAHALLKMLNEDAEMDQSPDNEEIPF